MKTIREGLKTYCEEHWWNGGKKTLSFKGELKELLEKHSFKFTKKKTENEGIFTFTFKNPYGVTFKATGLIHDFPFLAKQAIQMELVRMGDRSQLYVNCGFRPTVSVNS
jgi:hypothetical protein